MKKILLLIVTLFLAACGGGGSSTTDVNSSTPTGALSITFAGQQGAAKTSGGVTTILDHNRVRVIITNPNLRLNGAPFKAMQDVAAVPGATFSFALPLATGYLVEALTYNELSATSKVPVEYAVAKAVSVVSADPTGNNVTLVLQPVEAKLVVPATVLQGKAVTVLANLSTALGRTATPLQSAWYMPQPKSSPALIFTNQTSAYSYKGLQTATAWTVTGPGERMYFKGVFTLKPYMLDPTKNETLKMWSFGAPDPAFGNVSSAILAPYNVSIPVP
ncbi:hypothetical protein KP004_05130 [Geomonas oryzisoli]|uniref:DUF4382 domain-containing protein n=1 Tax=Geomonas oryzisoli TaxID=2847992 RepID=A0ABX8JCY1_9BACT|nr:hypothetical protein [Geomonas oryzisoli]QWV94572.1 hypothetical protein KP004_05130 [Geomonas oryzisoli]